MTIAQLREEAECRGIHKSCIPKRKKDILLFMVEGSIHLKATVAWQEVQRIKLQMDEAGKEFDRIKQQMEAEINEVRQKEMDQEIERQRQALEQMMKVKETEERKTAEAEGQKRQQGNARRLPSKSSEAQISGVHRAEVSGCGASVCDASVCDSDDDESTVLDEWDATKRFKKSILEPPAKNKTPNGNKMKGYTVWSSEEFCEYNDGIPPQRVFDSTWKTAEHANARAMYLFYWKSCWGLQPEEVSELFVGEVEIDGLKMLKASPPDSARWTVGVIPDFAFQHLNCPVPQRSDDEIGYGYEEDDESPTQWDVAKKFKKTIIHPSVTNTTPGGLKFKGYTVWSFVEHDSDAPGRKEFDSTWKTAGDANARAAYLFYCKNCWGVGPEEVAALSVEQSENDGLKTYGFWPYNNSCWMVGVVPDIAFKHVRNEYDHIGNSY